MFKSLVYDLPTRLFHWLFAGFFLVAFFIAKNFGENSPWFAFHSLCGLMVAGLVFFRVLWGIFGTRHARFSGFSLKPAHLRNYLWGVLKGSKKLWAGHNPASSWAALVMFFLSLGLAFTGYQITSGNELEALEEIHEMLANGFMIVAATHVGGVILHSFRHRDQIAVSMLTGKKSGVEASESIGGHQTLVGIVLLILLAVWGNFVFQNYDSTKGTLQFFGRELQLFESDAEDGTEREPKGD
ncbi:MAG: hypothetical protein RI932_1575 [Pseudomonadota bacterium]